jgi:hypothetical protein
MIEFVFGHSKFSPLLIVGRSGRPRSKEPEEPLPANPLQTRAVTKTEHSH